MKKIDISLLGILFTDVCSAPLERLPNSGECLFTGEMKITPGGCPVNSGIALARMGIRCSVMGKVGRDPLGSFLKDVLKKNRVDITGVKESDMTTATTMVLPIKGGDRRFITTVGANNDFSADDIDFDCIADSRIVYLGGYIMMDKFDIKSLIKVFKFAKDKGAITILDIIVTSNKAGLDLMSWLKPAFPYTDFFLPNDDEARAILGIDDPLKQAQAFVDAGAKSVVITMGERGSMLKTRDATLKAGVYEVPVCDPSGCGDAFDAGFIMGILKGVSYEDMLRYGSAVGALCVQELGCTEGIKPWDETVRFMEDNSIQIQGLKPEDII